jgi:hypothetical protein
VEEECLVETGKFQPNRVDPDPVVGHRDLDVTGRLRGMWEMRVLLCLPALSSFPLSLSLSLSPFLSLSLSPFLSLSLSLFGGQLQDLRGASGGLNGVSQQDVVQRGVMRHRGVGKIF